VLLNSKLLFPTLVLRIYPTRNIPVTDEKHLSQPTVTEICSNTEPLNSTLKNGMLKGGGGGGEDD